MALGIVRAGLLLQNQSVHPIESYLAKLAEIRASGHATDETSFYPAIEELLSEIGSRMKPRVKPVLQLRNRGAGLPDGGLFTQDQLKKSALPEDFTIQPPNRGVVEVKGLAEETGKTVQSEQVKKYLRAYGQVLLTNYRESRVVVLGKDDKPRTLETFTLAKSETAFWALAAHPRKAEGEVGKTLEEFLTRALLSAVPITSPDVLASFLASYAREALAKIEPRSSLKELEDVRKALEEALGLKFESDLSTEKENNRGKHFFRSTLVQTLFYGLFSAWVLWSREPGRRKGDQFEWKSAVWSLQVPMIRALFERLVTPSHVRSLGLEELLSLTGEVLNRVDTDAFFQQFEEDTAVQYFYEPFLEAFDPELRKQLGVWYTPREIVRYMVERVDTVLRTELGLPSGLADPNVYVLDPACGTGAYLVEVLDRIHRTLKEEGGEDALTPHQLKQAAKERVFGFEILPAPYVIAHLQLGMYLQRANAPLTEEHAGKRERASVYLTNALTGWEPPDKQKARLPFQEFEEEREEADTVKRDKPILVVLGNPPYNAFAGVSPTEEDGLVEPYKEGLIKEWGIKKFNLDDLYIRFFRLAERRIAEKSHRGVVCFISNMSWVREPSFVVLRKHLFNAFNKVWIENLHGNRKISEYAPDGRTSETVFAVAGFSPGIQQGVPLIRRERLAVRFVPFGQQLQAVGNHIQAGKNACPLRGRGGVDEGGKRGSLHHPCHLIRVGHPLQNVPGLRLFLEQMGQNPARSIGKKRLLVLLVWQERGGDSGGGFRALQLIAQPPIRTPGVKRIQDQVAARGRVELAYKIHRRVVNDGALSALLDLAQELPDGGRLAASGVAHQHNMAGLKAARNAVARPEWKPRFPA